MQDAAISRGTMNSKSVSSNGSNATDFVPQAGEDFVATPAIVELTNRALAYIEIGYAVHLSGPAGTGKTTLALHIASQIGRRCTLLHGDDELRGSDLLGKDAGFRRQSVRDNYVSSILKTEETVSLLWSNNRLTTACEQGHTVIYDEFTRSPAAANNAFLSILEEGILSIPSSGQDKNYVRVHPLFRAIFTSNPEEYVGVHKSQDALLDRMITLEVSHQDRETEIAIVSAKSERPAEEVSYIVDIIRTMRDKLGSKNGPTIRAALSIAKILDHRKASVSAADPIFMTTCQDVLFYNATRQATKPFSRHDLDNLIKSVLPKAANPKHDLQKSAKAAIAPKAIPAPLPAPAPAATSAIAQTRIVTPPEPVAERVAVALEAVSADVAAMTEPTVAEIALAEKADASLRVLEKQAVEEKPTDKVVGNEPANENVARRLPRPPSFESSGIQSGAMVSTT